MKQRPFLPFSRRHFLLAASAGIGMGLMPGFASAQEPKYGGVLRIVRPDAPDTLDPQASTAYSVYQVGSLVFDNLTALDDSFQPEPRLATRWTSTPDAKEWTFELREGVRFHHGKEFTADDVVATIERAENPSLGLLARGIFGAIDAVTAESRYVVRIKLKQPFAELPVAMADNSARILASDRLDDIATAPVGTGPFLFKGMQPGVSVTLEKNPDYWMQGRPYLDGVQISVIRNAVAQQAALLSGSADIITDISTEAYLQLRGNPAVKAYSDSAGQHHAIVTQCNRPPFDNPNVRRAFKYILNRKSLLQSALFGQGEIGNDVPLTSTNPYLPAGLPSHEQDLALARKLLDQEGVGSLKLDFFTTSDRPPAPKIAIAFAEAASSIGVEIKIRDVPYTEYSANVARKMPLYTSSWLGFSTLYRSVYRMHRRGMPLNFGDDGTDQTDAVLDKMVSAVDLDERKRLVAEWVGLSHEYSERVIPYFMNYFCATGANVSGFTPPKFNAIEVRSIWLA